MRDMLIARPLHAFVGWRLSVTTQRRFSTLPRNHATIAMQRSLTFNAGHAWSVVAIHSSCAIKPNCDATQRQSWEVTLLLRATTYMERGAIFLF